MSEADLLALQAALDEEESLALAERMQNEAYMGGLSARGARNSDQNISASSPNPLAANNPMRGYDEDLGGVGAMYTDQLIGGDDGSMPVDEYSSGRRNAPRDRFGAGA